MECDKKEYAFIQKMGKECGPARDGKDFPNVEEFDK